ncbi:hypothetical protein HMN09_00107100 [Mycena chlorophos]|uniref:Dipeptidyl-peptidase V n=1 Tax=Mycena chlorophos TaxID=658473 RepID=A0A8H6TQE4_MYCCL|nr:hypothetical protein HMN09_00107100 [Mycena chlorophos]
MPPPPPDYTGLEYTEPAAQIKAFNMNPVPQRIFDDMRKYEASARASTPSKATIGVEFGGPGGTVFSMDLDGNEYFQLWRYWEDGDSDAPPLPTNEGELNNAPGGRIERLTHDQNRYQNIVVSESQKIMTFVSNTKKTGPICSFTRSPSPRVWSLRSPRPATRDGGIESISMDDKYLVLDRTARPPNSSQSPSSPSPGGVPEKILLPGATEKESETVCASAAWSRNPDTPHLLYLNTDAYGAFRSIVTYDTTTRTVLHITTPEPHLRPICPINWDCMSVSVNSECVYFRANEDGYASLFRGQLSIITNARNGKPFELIMSLRSHKSQTRLVRVDLEGWLVPEKIETDAAGNAFLSVPVTPFKRAQPIPPSFPTFPSKIIRFKSFDGLEIPCMYYHPTDGKTVVPVGCQANSEQRSPIHWYLMNELGCAVLLPNVRGSRGYGKRFMAGDSVEKREDSVKDIGALLDHIEHTMQNELDSKRIAVLGGSYGGYMTLATLIHYPTRWACGVANFPIAHWPSFLEKTAPSRANHRRGKYGDERIPEIREFLERISPINRAAEIKSPLQLAHGESDSRVPVDQAIRMWKTVTESGVYTELMTCAKEGHGFRQKSVIEFVNAAKLHFIERYLVPEGKPSL